MSSIQKRTNGRWAVRWRDQENRQRWKTFGTETEAVEFRSRIDAELVLSVQPPMLPAPERLTPTVAEYYESWRSFQPWRATTAERVESQFRCHILPTFGDRRLANIGRTDVQLWFTELLARLAPTTADIVVTHFRSLLVDAIDDGHITTSPAQRLKRPSVPPRLVSPPTTEQVGVLLHTIGPRFRELVFVAAGTGMRQGELFGLTLDRIDRDRSSINVDRQVTETRGVASFGPLKTRSSLRRLPVPDTILAAVDRQIVRYGAGPGGLVFTDHRGEAIRRTRFWAIWHPAAVAAGLGPGQGMHCLRHFYASLLIRDGCSVKVVQARLGHSRASQTLDTYAHLWEDDDDRTREAIRALAPLERAGLG